MQYNGIMRDLQPNMSSEPVVMPSRGDVDVRSGVLAFSGLIAALVGCGVPLLTGVVSGWTPLRLLSYSALALLFVVGTTLHNLVERPVPVLVDPHWTHLLIMGLVALALQTLSGDPFIQPLIFTVLLVEAALCYPAGRTALVGGWLLGLTALGLWLSGQRSPAALLLPIAAYGALMVCLYAFTRMALDQATARARADALALDLARERDYLARLVESTATLTRELDVAAVLEQVARAGRTLAGAAQARVWLHETDEAHAATELRLAAAVPSVGGSATLTPDDRQALLSDQPSVSAHLLRLPLLFKQKSIGALELCAGLEQPFTATDAQVLQPFVDAATIAIVNARLYEQVRLAATLAERNRLGRELHDTIAQGLTAVSMQLAAAQRGFERDPARAHARLDRAAALTRETLEQVRRSVWMLAEPVIEGAALSAALDELTTRFVQRTGVAADYEHRGPPPALSHTAATQVLRIVQEALHNIEKHAHASRVQVRSCCDDAMFQVVVCDDGAGFDPAALPVPNSGGHDHRSGFGLLSLRERARLAGATLQIQSAPGAGTSILVTLSAER